MGAACHLGGMLFFANQIFEQPCGRRIEEKEGNVQPFQVPLLGHLVILLEGN